MTLGNCCLKLHFSRHIVDVVVPDGVYAGQTIQILLGGGRFFDIVVPNGFAAGMTFSVDTQMVHIFEVSTPPPPPSYSSTNPVIGFRQQQQQQSNFHPQLNIVGAKQFLTNMSQISSSFLHFG